MYYCDVDRDSPQADGDQLAEDWATSHDSVHDVLVNKKSNAMLMFILFFTEKDLVSFLCCCFAKVLLSHFIDSKGSGQVLWSYTGRNKMLPNSTSLPFTGEIAGVNMASLDRCLHNQRLGPDGWKGSTTNSTATCSTLKGMGSVRLHLALESP